MIPSLIFLYIIISFLILFPIKKEFRRNLFIILGIGLVFTAGIGGEGLTKDYDNYLNAFNSQNLTTSRLEPTFQLITLFVKSTLKDPIFLFLIYALIGVSIKFIAIRQLSNLILLSALLYLSNFFILHEMTQIRIGVAASFLLLCIKPLFDRDLKKFLLFTFFAICFHYSAIAFLILWFLHPRKFNKKVFYSLIPAVYLISLTGFSLTELIQYIPIPQIQRLYTMHEYEMRIGNREAINIFNFLQISRITIAFILVYHIEKLYDQNKFSILLVKIYLIGLTSLALFSKLPVLSFRISELFGVVEIILIPFLIYIYSPKKISVFYPLGIAAIMLWFNLFYIELILPE